MFAKQESPFHWKQNHLGLRRGVPPPEWTTAIPRMGGRNARQPTATGVRVDHHRACGEALASPPARVQIAASTTGSIVSSRKSVRPSAKAPWAPPGWLLAMSLPRVLMNGAPCAKQLILAQRPVASVSSAGAFASARSTASFSRSRCGPRAHARRCTEGSKTTTHAAFPPAGPARGAPCRSLPGRHAAPIREGRRRVPPAEDVPCTGPAARIPSCFEWRARACPRAPRASR